MLTLFNKFNMCIQKHMAASFPAKTGQMLQRYTLFLYKYWKRILKLCNLQWYLLHFHYVLMCKTLKLILYDTSSYLESPSAFRSCPLRLLKCDRSLLGEFLLLDLVSNYPLNFMSLKTTTTKIFSKQRGSIPKGTMTFIRQRENREQSGSWWQRLL